MSVAPLVIKYRSLPTAIEELESREWSVAVPPIIAGLNIPVHIHVEVNGDGSQVATITRASGRKAGDTIGIATRLAGEHGIIVRHTGRSRLYYQSTCSRRGIPHFGSRSTAAKLPIREALALANDLRTHHSDGVISSTETFGTIPLAYTIEGVDQAIG